MRKSTLGKRASFTAERPTPSREANAKKLIDALHVSLCFRIFLKAE
jgi:hypothetical protein